MIIDLAKFIEEERPFWDELEAMLAQLDVSGRTFSMDEIKRFHYLYQRTSADLGRLLTFAAEPETRAYLEALVARAYAEIHTARQRGIRFRPLHWWFGTFPRTVRRRWRALAMTVLVTIVGTIFGMGAIAFDQDAKAVIMPFSHLQGDPSDRVAQEESVTEDRMQGQRAYFASYLMTHNTKVSINAMALGFTWGIGTLVLLFYNGVILGAVAIDYMLAGETVFLFGWLLPHGSVEIPAILLAGQAGLVLGGALIGWGDDRRLRERMREITPDVATLIGGVALILVWAGIIESFFSQYHEPFLPYAVKIAFGALQLAVLIAFLTYSNRGAEEEDPAHA